MGRIRSISRMNASVRNPSSAVSTLGPAGPPGADDPRWQAVLRRDPGQDGVFVTAVLTTGIYCRPSCTAKRPRRENVRFYEGPEAAERAGFRACLRCRPKSTAAAPGASLVERVRRHFAERVGERVTLADLGRAVGLSPHHLQRRFKEATGMSPRQYAEALRLGHLKRHLKRKDSVTMALYEAGYGSSSRLYEDSARKLGMTPGDYRAGGRDADIQWASVTTSIGPLFVAATARGICSVKIGPTAEMERELRSEFPAATIRKDRNGLSAWVRALAEHLEGAAPALDLPLDIRATAFQWKVWQALRAIPYGSTRSYREIARSIGKPKAARAVGRACATNPVAIVIPCHRAVREDGTLGGFAYGLGVKKRLLDGERRGGPRARRPR